MRQHRRPRHLGPAMANRARSGCRYSLSRRTVVLNVLIAVCDDLKGLREAISTSWEQVALKCL